jgi:virulence-associated protein VagC
MNERIEKLISEAIKAIPDHVDFDLPKEFTEKFAELIVRECLKIVEPTEDSGDEWCVTLKGTAQEIKEHFGVE